MVLEIYPEMSRKMVKRWGSVREDWEKGIREITGIQARLTFFFWEVENMVSNNLLPNKLTLECNFIHGWLPIIYYSNISHDLSHFIRKKLIHFLFTDRTK